MPDPAADSIAVPDTVKIYVQDTIRVVADGDGDVVVVNKNSKKKSTYEKKNLDDEQIIKRINTIAEVARTEIFDANTLKQLARVQPRIDELEDLVDQLSQYRAGPVLTLAELKSRYKDKMRRLYR